MINQISKYIAAFDYTDKTLIILSATRGEVSIISFASVIWVSAGIASGSFALVFSLTRIIKRALKITRNKKKEHNKTVMLAKSKLNTIENLISQALIDLEISHEEFKTIIKEKEKYEKMKESITMMKSSDELSENNRSMRENKRNAYILIYFFLTRIKCLKSVLKRFLKTIFTT